MKPILSVVISCGNSRNPAKRQMEQDIIAALGADPRLQVTVVPHLNDARSSGTTVAALRAAQGDLVLLSWLYPRAAHWILNSFGIEGHVGQTQSAPEQPRAGQGNRPTPDETQRVIETRPLPDRKIYCLDLRTNDSAEAFAEEVNRIADANRELPESVTHTATGRDQATILTEEPTQRRWYPVIDYSRCTNCMECVDFCLFGVYGIDETDTILVEQPDTCRKGCPACSRVCPESAIMFPRHATPAIAGAPVGAGSLKVDLSRLFGAPEDDRSARELADQERETHLRQPGGKPDERDELDKLIDSLDELDL